MKQRHGKKLVYIASVMLLICFGSCAAGPQDSDVLAQGLSSAETRPPAVRPVLECVEEQEVGGETTYIAHFGYLNEYEETTILTGEENKFHPQPQDRGQTTEFLPGRHRQVFEVPFRDGNLVWTITNPDTGSRRTATASPNSKRCLPPVVDPTTPVRAILECIEEREVEGETEYVAHFGYLNENEGRVILDGAENKFTPQPQDRGQVTEFLPGRHRKVFEVPFRNGNLVWTLTSTGSRRTATASPNSGRCQP